MSYMITYCGVAFNLTNPRPEMVLAKDIVHGLARIGRFNGHTRTSGSYSVGQHSLLVATQFPVGSIQRFYGLLHDAHEVYMGDISRPIKQSLRDLAGHNVSLLDALEDELIITVFKRFGLDLDKKVWDEVKHADMQVLATELRYLMGSDTNPRCFENLPEPLPFNSLWPEGFICLDARETEWRYENEFNDTARRLGVNTGPAYSHPAVAQAVRQ